jgi:hypothetical protein
MALARPGAHPPQSSKSSTKRSTPDPATKARLISLGVESLSMTPAEFGKRIADDTEKWAKVIKFANITAE